MRSQRIPVNSALTIYIKPISIKSISIKTTSDYFNQAYLNSIITISVITISNHEQTPSKWSLNLKITCQLSPLAIVIVNAFFRSYKLLLAKVGFDR